MKIVTNMRVQEYEKLSSLRKVYGLTKKEFICDAIKWQLDEIEKDKNKWCIVAGSSARRTVTCNISKEEEASLRELEKTICAISPAQAVVVAVRNMMISCEEGENDYVKNLKMKPAPDTLSVLISKQMHEAISKTNNSFTGAVRVALNECRNIENLPDIPKRRSDDKIIQCRLGMSDKENLNALVLKHRESRIKIVNKVLTFMQDKGECDGMF